MFEVISPTKRRVTLVSPVSGSGLICCADTGNNVRRVDVFNCQTLKPTLEFHDDNLLKARPNNFYSELVLRAGELEWNNDTIACLLYKIIYTKRIYDISYQRVALEIGSRVDVDNAIDDLIAHKFIDRSKQLNMYIPGVLVRAFYKCAISRIIKTLEG